MRLFLSLTAAFLCLVLLGTSVLADKIVDKDQHLLLSPQELAQLAVLSDGKGHYIVVTKPDSTYSFMYYGDETSLHEVHMVGVMSDPTALNSWTIKSPRLEQETSYLEASGSLDLWSFHCGDRQSALTIADEKARAQVLGAHFNPPKWRRYPYLLSRDSRGIYYYVDDELDDAGKMNLYIGRPGKMRTQTIIDTVRDSEGAILFTKRGKLRIDGRYGLPDRKVTWILGKKRTELLFLSEKSDASLIYNVLGIYAQVHLGNPCEDF